VNTKSKKLSGKVAVVTGASKGIGAAIAGNLAAEGAEVVVNYASDNTGADKVVAKIIDAGGNAIAVQGDITKKAEIERIFATAMNSFARIDILVNNAGIYEVAPLGQITEDHIHRQLHLNVFGLILTTQEALKYFGPEGGNIINISSIVSTLSPAGTSVYNATKSAVDGLTRTFAKELAGRNIRVNSVNPGLVETEGVHSTGLIKNEEAVAKATPLGRIGQPQDIAPCVAFLASAESGWITGESLYATGGLR
jgi:3-oxoacyl-[acyl-carrier protein] reductase